jgi:hypothetical protein
MYVRKASAYKNREKWFKFSQTGLNHNNEWITYKYFAFNMLPQRIDEFDEF